MEEEPKAFVVWSPGDNKYFFFKGSYINLTGNEREALKLATREDALSFISYVSRMTNRTDFEVKEIKY